MFLESEISSGQDENLLPKSKRMKHEEGNLQLLYCLFTNFIIAHDIDKDESDSENERNESLCKTEEIIKKIGKL